MISKKTSKKELAEPAKAVVPKKENRFYGSEAFNKILVDALVTRKVVEAEPDSAGLADYYLSMADSALKGDIQPIETMLMAQACTLDLLFNKCVRIARNSEFLNGTEAYSNMAFKAQKQCRQTLLALREVQHPHRATFVKQQNNAINQQVNNNSTEKDFQKNSANELLTEVEYETMDTRGTFKASRTDKELEAVGTVHGGKD